MPALNRARLHASLLLLTLFTSLGLVGAAAPASASTFGSRVVAEAARQKGDPYVYGAAGPNRFDCSGLTMFVFKKFGKRLPHNSARQYAAVRHVRKSSLAVGDLIFFKNSSGRISHVGLYAGNGKMWHAPRSGSVVKLAPVYSNRYVVGRV